MPARAMGAGVQIVELEGCVVVIGVISDESIVIEATVVGVKVIRTYFWCLYSL